MSLNYAAGQLSVSTLLGLCLLLPRSRLKDKIMSEWNLCAPFLSEEGSPWSFIVVVVFLSRNAFCMKVFLITEVLNWE